MADEKPKSSWLKAIGTSVFGLASGAVLMYATSFVNYFVKPKPLANFAYQSQGLGVTFSNRSTNATQGWWDFGDGSPLEPYSPEHETVAHTYPRPGVYTAKLSVTNLFGDENDRSVPVTLDASQQSTAPAIDKFTVTPLKKELTAPVTVRVESTFKNAQLSIWSAGDITPLEITHDPAANQNRLVTYMEPGTYNIRLVAVNGKEAVERTETITVAKGNELHAHVALNVSFEAVRNSRVENLHHRMIAFPADRTQTKYTFKKEFHPRPGNQITDARLATPVSDPAVTNVKLDIAADKSTAYLTGELTKESRNSPPTSWHAEVMLVEEAQTGTETKKSDPVVVTLNLPTGSEKAVTLLPMPVLSDKWAVKDRQVSLEVRDRKKVVWSDTKLPATATMRLRDKTWHVSVVESNGSVRLEVQESRAAAVVQEKRAPIQVELDFNPGGGFPGK